MAPALGVDDAALLGATKQQLSSYPAQTHLVDGWPDQLNARLAWKPTQFNSEDKIVYRLSQADVIEIEQALRAFNEQELEESQVDRTNFPLPTLHRTLAALALDVHKGKGFVVIRGLELKKYSFQDNIVIYLGISSYIGNKTGRQDHNGTMLLHIRNAIKMSAPQQERPARDSNLELSFHTDVWADILALQTLGCAAKGGNHIIAPAYTIYNDLAATRPDLLQALAAPDWLFDKHSLHHTPNRRSLIHYHNGRVLFNFGRLPLFGHSATVVKTHLSVKQLEALEALQELAEKHQLSLPLQRGDLCYINNFAILHSREAFEDSPRATRHLVRLWLKNEALAWKLPEVLKAGNDKVFSDDETTKRWEILPPDRLGFDVREKFGP